MELRYYQRSSIDATYNYLRYNPGNPCIVIPTGGGKTAVMATMAMDAWQKWGRRCLILSHVKELIDQTAQTLSRLAPDLQIGVYSAGLKSRDTDTPILCAGIQSVYKRADELGEFGLILVDEAHLIPPDGDGMYQTYLSAAKELNPRTRLVGLTATPYRLKSGAICGKDNLLNDISYEISVKELIDGGYLSHITSRGGSKKVDTSSLHIVRGDFDLSEIDVLMDNDYLLSTVVEDIKQRASDRKSILVFCPSVAVSERFIKRFKASCDDSIALITGKTPASERDEIIKRFKGAAESCSLFGDKPDPIRVLVNINVLTTGFDAPNVDCIVMLRPTASPGLYYQQVGRGFRTCEGKKDCLVLDYVGNIMRHGPVDIITPPDAKPEKNGRAPVKECPECNAIVHASFRTCPECGFEFPVKEIETKINCSASDDAILSGEVTETDYKVFDTYYQIHEKEKEDGTISRTIEVGYRIALHIFKKEFLCVEHSGYAYEKFVKWWDAHVCSELKSTAIKTPHTCEDFMDYVEYGCFAEAEEITVRRKGNNDKYGSVIKHKLKEPPAYNVLQQRINDAINNPQDITEDNYGYY